MATMILPLTAYDSLTIFLLRLAATIATPFLLGLSSQFITNLTPFLLMLIKLEPEL